MDETDRLRHPGEKVPVRGIYECTCGNERHFTGTYVLRDTLIARTAPLMSGDAAPPQEALPGSRAGPALRLAVQSIMWASCLRI
ncbi:hypothetical protein ACFW3D_32815 [Streptomyces sp. NPDC058864]